MKAKSDPAGFVRVFLLNNMAEGKKSVLLYCDLIHTVEKMDDETAGLFFKHYLRYVNDLQPETDNLVVDIAFESVKQNLKRDLKKWEERAQKSRENGKKGGRPKKPNETKKTQQVISKPRKPDTVTVTDTVNDNDIIEVDSLGSSNEQPQAPKKKRTIFKPPELSEVQTYCQERGKGINAQQWHDHYTANGWMVGKNKMKDWKAAVRTWERNNINNGDNGTKKPSGQDRMQALKNWGAD